MITVEQFLMGRDKQYADEFTDEIARNAKDTVDAINPLLSQFTSDTGIAMNVVASGWRPAEVNETTSNAACNSWHIHAGAVDIRDTPNRDLARWVAKNQAKLVAAGLYCERFEWTPTWVHFSKHPPKSGKRFYIPSAAPAKCARLDEQNQFNC